jgi:hypothetical protein
MKNRAPKILSGSTIQKKFCHKKVVQIMKLSLSRRFWKSWKMQKRAPYMG